MPVLHLFAFTKTKSVFIEGIYVVPLQNMYELCGASGKVAQLMRYTWAEQGMR